MSDSSSCAFARVGLLSGFGEPHDNFGAHHGWGAPGCGPLGGVVRVTAAEALAAVIVGGIFAVVVLITGKGRVQ